LIEQEYEERKRVLAKSHQGAKEDMKSNLKPIFLFWSKRRTGPRLSILIFAPLYGIYSGE
jgi:hypothetical protein